MATVKKEQLRALLLSVKSLESDGSVGKPVEVTNYNYEEHGYLFRCLNIDGLKSLLRMNRDVFEFADPSILDSSTDLISGIVVYTKICGLFR